MQEIIGTSNKILEIDLSTSKFQVTEIDEKDLQMYLGGRGLGLKLLYDRLKPGVDPLGKDNVFVLAMGALVGTNAPCSARFEAVTKSPLTGIMDSCSCGGPFGIALKTSGWDGVIIKGAASQPTYLVIDSKGVKFKSAKTIWGKTTSESQEPLEKEGSGALVIGPAGENLVRYANICSGQRFLGRGGMGAVWGAKKLKGIVAKGNEYKIVPAKMKKFEKTKKKALRYINRNSVTSGSYRKFGTNANVNLNNAAGILPVRNFSDGVHPDAYNISGENMAEKFNTKYHTCKPCSILCGHKGTVNGKEHGIPEYETTGLFGANLQIFDPSRIVEWNDICSAVGMDTISAAGTIAWVMEATEKGLVDTKLKFGSPNGVSDALRDIAYMKGFGKDMALGTRALSKKYGGEDFAIQVKGLEMAAYDPRGVWGQGLSYAVANRGACHVQTAIFALEAYFHFLSPYSTRAKPHVVKYFEDFNSGINSLHTCLFTSFAYTLEIPLIKLLPAFMLRMSMMNMPALALQLIDVSLYSELWASITGRSLSMWKFLKAGERTWVLERYMNTREGISRKDDTLPMRLLGEGRASDPKKRKVPLYDMLDKYYSVRGYDAMGIPKDKTLKRLGIEKK